MLAATAFALNDSAVVSQKLGSWKTRAPIARLDVVNDDAIAVVLYTIHTSVTWVPDP